MSWYKWFGGAPVLRPTSRHAARREPVSRRAFLGGGAAMIGLPYLVSLVPREARAVAAADPVRLLYWYGPCGIRMEHWVPSATGTGYDLPRILAPLANVQSKVSVLTGLANRAAQVPVAGDHARGTGSFLTCEEVRLTDGADILNGQSADQFVAQALAGTTPFNSLELGTTGGSSIGNCDSGYSCAYTRNISWLDEDTPMPKMTDPRLVFDRLFAGYDTEMTQEAIERRKRWRTSVLDHALDDTNTLMPKLSRSDQAKLDEYLTGLRELEVRIELADQGTCVPGDRPDDAYDYQEVTTAMIDLQVKALECDLTRVITFMLENGGSYRSFDFLGVTGAHHELSHHQSDPTKLEALSVIGTWQMQQFAYLLEQLDGIEESNGSTLLDNVLAYFSSEISDGDRHNHDDLPVLLAGLGGGYAPAGQHKRYSSEQPVANLYIAMAEAAGVAMGPFGQDGTGPLDLS